MKIKRSQPRFTRQLLQKESFAVPFQLSQRHALFDGARQQDRRLAEADYHPNTGKARRAMADAEMAANLTAHLAQELRQKHGLRELSHDLPAAKINEHLKRHRGF